MKIRFLLVGKPHASYYSAAYEEYKKKLLKYASVEVIYVKEQKLPDRPSPSEIKKALDKEALDIQKSLHHGAYVIALDLKGKEMDSLSFAFHLQKVCENNVNIDFIIGSSYGLSDNVRNFSNFLVKLSLLTFTHPLALLVTMEQVYRALKINAGETYQK